MQSLNRFQLIGNVGNEPTLRSTDNGHGYLHLSIATTEKEKKDGEYKDRTRWNNVMINGKTAKYVSEFITKGNRVFIEGVIETVGKEVEGGKKVYKTYLNARNIINLSPPKHTAREETRVENNGDFIEHDLPF